MPALVRRFRCTRPLPILLCAALLPLFSWAEKVQDLPAAPTDYVQDLAGVLSPAVVQDLNQYLASVDHQAHAQIFVATIHKIDNDQPIEDFSHALFERWGPGRKGHETSSNRGVLLLLSVEDRKYRIEVGYGLEGILNDAKIGDIGRLMLPYLRQQQYGGAVEAASRAIGSVIATDAGVMLDTPQSSQRGMQQPPPLSAKSRAGGFLFLIILIAVVVLIFRSMGGGPGGGGPGGFLIGMLLGNLLGGGGRRGGWGDGGGGGFGGGDGGGFGGGGGGDSGGGGAGGGW